MKCPHCKRPVHVQRLSLGKGRTTFGNSYIAFKNKAHNRSLMLVNLINYCRSDLKLSYNKIAQVIGRSTIDAKYIENLKKFQKMEDE